ncbi:LOW QUALITY PROTEIN: hypothetical protein BCV70DRAFT_213686 [Testicularia cyperi]|uniref:C3H1-type domain-containing protein n=1 Tax=Testicularia cyperi TaxID=1882483 RepID=A0A317XGV1_9BASI|nr:LOW QUALITY PROTEIN: hypothetical protein BCV70DRAFT_213686 [Testicularia cyperi]
MTTTIFQACQDGKVELVSQLLESNSVENIDAKDDQGLSALQHAIRGNHTDVVAQLLAKGANAAEITHDEAVKNNPELSQLVSNTLQHTQSVAFQSAPVIDPHGGKAMPDGSVSYMQPPSYQGHPMEYPMHHQDHLPPQHAYGYQLQYGYYEATPSTAHPEQHGHRMKDSSSGNLPPPEVARMIPCRFFPNCRYGEKCIFAHPMPLANGAGPNGSPASPGQAPVFYQAPGYGYPAYGPPQHFYSMAPPMPIQYSHAGVPMPVHMPPPPHAGPGPHGAESSSLPHHDAFAPPFASQPQSQTSDAPNGAPREDSPHASQSSLAETAVKVDEVSQPAASSPAPATEKSVKAVAQEVTASGDSTPAAPANGSKPSANATQADKAAALQPTSFSAFMTHHAVPFQPGHGNTQGGEGVMASGTHGFPRTSASLGGSFGSRTEFTKRSGERPPCAFFARSACRHGEDCRFPHILADGTDARGPNASRAINRALAAKTGRNTGSTGHAHSFTSLNGTSAHATHHSSANIHASSGMNGRSNNNANSDVSSSNSAAAGNKTPAATLPAPVPEKKAPAAAPAQDKKDAALDTLPPKTQAAPIVSLPATPASTVETADTKTNATTPSATTAANGAAVSPRPSAPNGSQQSGERTPAPIPSKPLANGRGRPQTGGKPQPQQGANAGQGPSQSGNSARGNGANGRSNQSNHGRPHANGAPQAKKSAPPQKVPNPDDFPALGNKANAAPAPVANGAPKKAAEPKEKESAPASADTAEADAKSAAPADSLAAAASATAPAAPAAPAPAATIAEIVARS